ncbi:DUF885 domain-containing protein [Pleionea litopenaei]|uniref:DUF885 domain-containing protein n=1 Tax=Pleionea litopenaei TaxID=3070815 RepID=A0AA51X7D9_9GAMM|nr:DUF885 domain-containing protein [Pleionea sp. HL-JVS1]WMS87010.1 DUF885 domain-containing protein [Pleionea sp. HL-JVS1]
MAKYCVLISVIWLLWGCGSSNSNNPPDLASVELPEVIEYDLQPTVEVIDAAEQQLEGLTVTAFMDQSFALLERRSIDDVIGANRESEFSDLPLHLSNISDEYYLQSIALKSFILQSLINYDLTAESEETKIGAAIFRQWLEREVEAGDYYLLSFPGTAYLVGWPSQTESYFTQVLTLDSSEQVARYLTLLNQVALRFAQIETLVTVRANAGIIEPSYTLQPSIDYLQSLADVPYNEHPFYRRLQTALQSGLGLTATERDEALLLAAAMIERRVKPAYLSLVQTLNSYSEQAPDEIGFSQFPNGAAFYQSQLNYFTETEQTAEQVHQLGLDQMVAIHQQMRERFALLGYPSTGSIAQLINRARNESGVIRSQSAVTFFENLIAEAYAQLPLAFNQIPITPVIVVGGPTGGYYIAGSDDGSRPGAFYAQTNQDLNYLTMPTLAYHEAIPGHHLQIALSQELQLPRYRREIRFTSFIEGWGLYAERLAFDLGWYQDDIYGDLGRLQFEAMRASRLVIDTGIHALGWSVQQAQNYSQTNVGFAASLPRYSVWPGQATAYTSGSLKLLELRQQAQDQLGNDFDYGDFHDAVLKNGSVSLRQVEESVNQYIMTTLTQP